MKSPGSRTRSRLYVVALVCALALMPGSPLVRQGAAVRAAGGASLRFDQRTGTCRIGQSFHVSVLVDTGGEVINAVEADLTFPASLLEVTSVDASSGSFLPIVVEKSYNNTSGHIRIVGGVPTPGFTSGSGRVAGITFRARTAGLAKVSFDGTSKLMRNDDNINVLAATSSGLFTISGTAAATTTIVLVIGQTTMTVNGRKVAIDPSGKVAPMIRNGRTLLPVRVLIETLGGTAGWSSEARKATVKLGGKTVQFWIGKSIAMVNGKQVTVDTVDRKVVPVIIQGRTLLPLRFLSESLGLSVVWNAAARRITLTYRRQP
ncbi:MAG: stalk domain-containing protein [Candidatus Cryosericum sp.]